MYNINELTDMFVKHVRSEFGDGFVALHRPLFDSVEKHYLTRCIDNEFVSSAGNEIDEFEAKICDITMSDYAKATVTGTAALHLCLHALGVRSTDEVITQRISFIATANAIAYCNASPVFIDVEDEYGTLCPILLRSFLENDTTQVGDCRINKRTGRLIKACVVMHTFGHPARMLEIRQICDEFGLMLVEDAAEALGSRIDSKHVGAFSHAAAYSFNGNKIITTGGGGCVTTNDPALAKKVRHISTTAKVSHQYEYCHDELGFNYRMPNLNACLGLAQIEKFDYFLENKRQTATKYHSLFVDTGVKFWVEKSGNKSNYWLNALSFKSKRDKDFFLKKTNSEQIMTRPVWQLLDKQPYFAKYTVVSNGNAERIYDTTVNIPSSVTKLI